MAEGKKYASCQECVYYYIAYSVTGEKNAIGKCEKDDQPGVATIGSVKEESDCPYFKRQTLTIIDKNVHPYPRVFIKENIDDVDPIENSTGYYGPDGDPDNPEDRRSFYKSRRKERRAIY